MNTTIHRRRPGPVPGVPSADVRLVQDDDHEAIARLLGAGGESEIGWWRLFGTPQTSFVVEAGGIVAVSLVVGYMGKFWITYASTAPGPAVTAVVAASLRALDAPVHATVDEGDTASEEMLIALGFTAELGDLPVLVVDGALFSDFDGFAREFTKLLCHYEWTGNLDAFNDILRGGFGTPELGWVFRWVNAEKSRTALGHRATAKRLEGILKTCHPTNRASVEARIEAARRGEGPTLFDDIVEIIRDHGPGGDESEDNVILELR
ncbi:hypothetical protein [Lentzea sp. NBRC 102530]|uniref:hypothetical protein n=1 Tax=Lentzea sp. NBRC 102530 TaxID=3032201 RepID=UPI0024A557B7|nr:hypothetical protein [Lentzea sp. NBRC 102530]GLY51690.1 hypothetical protein Lesp01_53460 [Lentzea sp. NBRC 102530]